MKRNLLLIAMMMLGFAFPFTSCSDDNNEEDGTESRKALVCVEQMIDGCIEIANEVGGSKIGEPYDLYNSGETEKALYAVESWYSWHSIEDYANNIRSIRNTYFGTTDGSVGEKSLSKLIAATDPTFDQRITAQINATISAIEDIPAPFRNNINSSEAKAAMKACTALATELENLKGYLNDANEINTDEVLGEIVNNYVDAVVLPTYKELMEKNTLLNTAVKSFAQNPSDENFLAVSQAWLNARQPWETSEAFLFGPVDALGLDPNMDSWPLDQKAILDILNSGHFEYLNWSDDDDDDEIEAKQNVRGFHTLEFLVFKNGKARTLNDGTSKDPSNLDYTAENAKSWGNYMVQVAYLLQKDATNLYKAWTENFEGTTPYAEQFKNFSIK